MTQPSPIEALAQARRSFANSAHTRDDVWLSHNDIHVEGMHRNAWQLIERSIDDAMSSGGPSPLGVVVQGPAGSGKTHLLGQVREYIQSAERGGYFVMLDLLDPSDFWRTMLSSLLDSLNRQIEPPIVTTQVHELMRRLADLANTKRSARRALSGETLITPDVLDEFVDALRKPLPTLIRSHHATLRALVLTAAPNSRLNDLGIAYLENNIEEIDASERNEWQLPPRALPPEQTARAISEFMAATGPSVLAVDQIDTLLAQSRSGTDQTPDGAFPEMIVDQVAHGLMSVREVLLRTVSIVSCLPAVWTIIESQAIGSVRDRFRPTRILEGLPDEVFARALVERRLSKTYSSIGFTPRYPTWPIKDQAFTGADSLNARLLIKRVDRHINECLDDGVVTELDTLVGDAPARQTSGATTGSPPRASGSPPATSELDAVYQRHINNAITATAVDHKKEDSVVPALLNAAIRAWIIESGSDAYTLDNVGGQFRLHARLRQALDSETDDEHHWAFRAIASTNAVAVQTRLRNASIEAGLAGSVSRRELFILRSSSWPSGAKTASMVDEFTSSGGQVLELSTSDIAKLSALNEMLKSMPPGFDTWLRARQPAHDIEFLQAALGDARTIPVPRPTAAAAEWTTPTVPVEPDPPVTDAPQSPAPTTFTEIPDHDPTAQPEIASPTSASPTSIGLGVSRSGKTATIALEALRKHTAIFAGSGSGKTVMIRRLIEECALQGVSAIVLDPNNDLARLGTAWPEPPAGWSGDDAAKAADYIANVETVIWTPRRTSGRPLSFQPLPDFASVREDPDEFELAVDAAVSALKPYAGVSGTKAALQEAILKTSMALYGKRSGGSLSGYVDLLADMTDDMSGLTDTGRLAAVLAENLKAAMIINPMLGGEGTAVDPSLLLTPTDGKRARISVISLIGLPDEAQRQGFVNQLELALFAWIKKNPAGSRPLGGLFVMDEAQTLAPAGKTTACTQSTIALASQARKYGLGLVFATQSPKGIDNKIVGNASTQFFGRLNSPAQINAAAEMAAAKGTRINDIGHLGTGEFYVAPDGASFQKVNTPLCLSYHPSSPLSDEEVLALSRR